MYWCCWKPIASFVWVSVLFLFFKTCSTFNQWLQKLRVSVKLIDLYISNFTNWVAGGPLRLLSCQCLNKNLPLNAFRWGMYSSCISYISPWIYGIDKHVILVENAFIMLVQNAAPVMQIPVKIEEGEEERMPSIQNIFGHFDSFVKYISIFLYC